MSAAEPVVSIQSKGPSPVGPHPFTASTTGEPDAAGFYHCVWCGRTQPQHATWEGNTDG